MEFCRSVTKTASKSAQLTIFYAGAVNVFDDVPLDKVMHYIVKLMIFTKKRKIEDLMSVG